MASQRGSLNGHRLVIVMATTLIVGSVAVASRADTITMKNGIVYRSLGAPDRDNTLIFIWDGLKRTVVRESKIERMTGDSSFRTGEMFKLDQPLTVHAGRMPEAVVSVQASPWDDKGRRLFQFVGPKLGKPISMEQAIIEMRPDRVKFRGINGFWVSYLSTSVVPREVLVGLLGRVEQGNQAERERAIRFEIEAGWYEEARKELEGLIRDFPNPELRDRATTARNLIIQAEASQRRSEIDIRRRAHQFRKVDEILKSLNQKDLRTEFQAEVREL